MWDPINPLVLSKNFFSFFFEVLEKMPLYKKSTHQKPYLNIFNGLEDIGKLKFLIFLTVRGKEETKYAGTFRLFVLLFLSKIFFTFLFLILHSTSLVT
jgi:hypothetical protein